MAPIYSDFDDTGVDADRTALGKAHPEHATATSGSPVRCEPMLTPAKLRKRFLFGIPLVSPVTKEKLTDTDLKDFITRGINQAELTSQLDISPVERTKKLPFDRHLYHNWVHLEVPNKPINRVLSLTITTADNVNVFTMPQRWLETSNFHRGLINVIPISPAFAAIGAQTSAATGGAAFLTFIGQLGWIPAYWQLKWVAGFDKKAIPIVLNELIGIEAAMLVLSMLAAQNKTTGHSLGADGLSQSVSTPGPQIYVQRMNDLKVQKKEILDRLKKIYGNSMIVSNI
jgi:hypothetical protein